MEVKVLMPQMGESVTEAVVAKWLVKVGDFVKRDQPILEISTDKVDSEVPSPADGQVKEILVKEGQTVPVKTLIAIIVSGENASESKTDDASKQDSQVHSSESHNNKQFLSPIVKELVKEHGLSEDDIRQIRGTGSGGRVTKTDVLKYVQSKERENAISGGGSKLDEPQLRQSDTSWSSKPFNEAEISPQVAKQLVDNEFTVTPMDIMRRTIAEHMVRSKSTSPHVYSIVEVDCSQIVRFRQKVKDEFSKREGYSLSFTPFFLEAAVKGVLEFPILNCSVDGSNIIYKKHIHLGVAVAIGNTGLIVPVIKRAEEKSFLGLARALNILAEKARSKKLSPEEVAGGTFTVTNPGVFGTLIGTPIINQPQVAILCLGAITKRPAVVDDDKIAIRDLCYLTLSYDHRVIDGSVSGQFLSFVKKYIETWDINRNIFV
ncbi:MAG: 2-oxo acid dehydrogenase subunit E2 [Deltaproteobacteria bacterium]|nr:2-oxo acid dehydrogenase subunit E2 [Deltaproteobacteria bacterium]MCX7952555.1 2-oxo acid dehydrogenase subunit E2 [Deltaproteobacteria bacterium]